MYKYIKRFFDFFFSILGITLLLPLMLPLIVLLFCTGEHHIFYLQKRIGYKNRVFRIWKFATMLRNSPDMGTGDITLKNDSRVLPVGKFLRKTKINEVPQLVNIVTGQMSFVGARPLMKQSFDLYSEEVKKVIYNSPPGITGLASIVFRDEESVIASSGKMPREFYEKEILPYKGELEQWYQRHQSFYLDFIILLLTFWIVIFPQSRLVYKVYRSLPQRPF